MEDVEQLVIANLAHLVPHLQVTSLESLLQPTVFVPFTAACLAAIQQDSPIVTNLPQSMSQKYSVCSGLSKLMKDLGYSGSLGFNVFLYPNVKEVRSIVNFLIDRMPKEAATEEAAEENVFYRKLRLRIKGWIEEAWTPPFDLKRAFKLKAAAGSLETILAKDLPPELEALQRQFLQSRKHGVARFLQVRQMAFLPSITQQAQLKSAQALITDEVLNLTKPTYIEVPAETKGNLPSLTSVLQRIPGRSVTSEVGSVFSHETMFKQEPELVVKEEVIEKTPEVVSEVPVVVKSTRAQEVDDLEKQLEAISAIVYEAEGVIVHKQMELTKTEAILNQIKSENEQLRKEADHKHRAAIVLKDDSSLIKLREELEEQQLKLADAHKEWLEYKQPLEAEIKSQERALEKMRQGYVDKIEQIKQMKAEMRDMQEEAQFKEELLELLQAEEAKEAAPVTRTVYIRRITEVSDRMKKQKRELVQCMRDVIDLQQSISVSRDTIARTDAATEDLVFQDAKKNSASKSLYKLLVDLREQYAALVQSVEAQNKLKSSMRDVELRIETLRARNANHDIQRLREDIEKVKQERGIR